MEDGEWHSRILSHLVIFFYLFIFFFFFFLFLCVGGTAQKLPAVYVLYRGLFTDYIPLKNAVSLSVTLSFNHLLTKPPKRYFYLTRAKLSTFI